MRGPLSPAAHHLIEPPPIVQLHIIDPHTCHPPFDANPDADDANPNYALNFLQDPYYFMFASLAKLDDDTELHWLKDGKTRYMTGSVVSSLYHLKNTQICNKDADVFVFPHLHVHTEGSYRLKFHLFRVIGDTIDHCKSIYSAFFYVYAAKKLLGMEDSAAGSCSLANQDIKIRFRKEIRMWKRPLAALVHPSDGSQPNAGEPCKLDQDQNEDDIHGQQSLSSQLASDATAPSTTGVKRARHATLTAASVASSDGMSAHTPVSANNPGSSIALAAGLPAWPTPSTLYGGASGANRRGGYDAGGARGGYESGAGSGRTGFEHSQQHPHGSYDPRGYKSSQAPFRAPYNPHPHTQTQAHTNVHGHPSRASSSGLYESQPYQDTLAGYAHASLTGWHSHHLQQGQYPSPTRPQYLTLGYPGRYNVGANQNGNPSANANGPGASGSGGYYYNIHSSSSSPYQHSQAYYAGGSSGQAVAQPLQVTQPLTHAASYASQGSAGSAHEYGGQGQEHDSSFSADITPNRDMGTDTRGESCRLDGPSGGGQAHELGQQEMIHLAPLRYAPGAGSAGSSSSSSALMLPSSGGGGYPVIQLSQAPFEQDGCGVPARRAC